MKPTPSDWPRMSSAVVYLDAVAAIRWLCEAFGFAFCRDSLRYCSFAYSALASFRRGSPSSAQEGQPAAASLGNLGCRARCPCSDLYEDR